MKGYEYQSDFAKRYFAQGRTEGHTEGFTKRFFEGLAKGRTEKAARAVLTVLRARGFAVSDAARERILAQNDPESS